MAQKTSTKPAAKTVKTPAKAAAPAKAKTATGPLAKMKAVYGTKDKLIDKLAGSLVHDGADEGSIKDRLAKASNAQVLRLASVSDAVKKAYGSRDKLVESLSKALGRAKDKDYMAKLSAFSLPRLFDMAKSTERKAKAANKA
jgi:hypothetical protein